MDEKCKQMSLILSMTLSPFYMCGNFAPFTERMLRQRLRRNPHKKRKMKRRSEMRKRRKTGVIGKMKKMKQIKTLTMFQRHKFAGNDSPLTDSVVPVFVVVILEGVGKEHINCKIDPKSRDQS